MSCVRLVQLAAFVIVASAFATSEVRAQAAEQTTPVLTPPDQACVSSADGLAPAAGVPAFVRADVRVIADEVTCYCGCPHLQVSKCYCGTADAIRKDFAARLDAGQTAAGIIAAYVAEHGPGIMAVPPKRGFHWIVWIGPPLLLLFGAIGVGIMGRRFARRGAATDLSAVSLDPEQEARYRERIRRAVEES